MLLFLVLFKMLQCEQLVTNQFLKIIYKLLGFWWIGCFFSLALYTSLQTNTWTTLHLFLSLPNWPALRNLLIFLFLGLWLTSSSFKWHLMNVFLIFGEYICFWSCKINHIPISQIFIIHIFIGSAILLIIQEKKKVREGVLVVMKLSWVKSRIFYCMWCLF